MSDILSPDEFLAQRRKTKAAEPAPVMSPDEFLRAQPKAQPKRTVAQQRLHEFNDLLGPSQTVSAAKSQARALIPGVGAAMGEAHHILPQRTGSMGVGAEPRAKGMGVGADPKVEVRAPTNVVQAGRMVANRGGIANAAIGGAMMLAGGVTAAPETLRKDVNVTTRKAVEAKDKLFPFLAPGAKNILWGEEGLITPAMQAELRKSPDGTEFLSTLQNMDISQMPDFLNSLTEKGGAQQTGEHFQTLFQKALQGDQLAYSELMGLRNALVAGVLLHSIKGVVKIPGMEAKAPGYAAKTGIIPKEVIAEPALPSRGTLTPAEALKAREMMALEKGPKVESAPVVKAKAAVKKVGAVPIPKKPVVAEPDLGQKSPWQMTKDEFANEFDFHSSREGTASKIREQGINPGSWFARIARDAQNYSKAGNVHENAQSPVFGVRRSSIRDIPADAEDIFGQEFSKSGIYRRSGDAHTPDFEVPGKAANDPHRFLVEQAINEGRSVPPEVLAEYPDLASSRGTQEPKGQPLPGTTVGERIIPGEALAGQKISVDRITFSGKNGETVDVPLGGKVATSSPHQLIADTLARRKARLEAGRPEGTEFLGSGQLVPKEVLDKLDFTHDEVMDLARGYYGIARDNFKAFADGMVKHLTEAVRPHLEAVWESLGGKNATKEISDHSSVQAEPQGGVKGGETREAGTGDSVQREAAKQGEVEPPAKTQQRVPVKKPEPSGTVLHNKVLRAVREQTGLEPWETTPTKMSEAAQKAVEKGYHKPDSALATADRIIDGTTRTLDHEQSLGMAAALDDLIQQHEKLSEKIEDAAENGGDLTTAREMVDLTDKISRLTQAGQMAGTEWGRSGVARQAMMKSDGSFGGIVARRMKAVERKLTVKEIAEARKEAADLKKAGELKDKRIKELEKIADTQDAQDYLNNLTRREPRTRRADIDTRIKETSTRLKEKWAKSKPPPVTSSSFFGADIAAAQLARLADIAPEILEIVKLYKDKGLLSLADNTKAVVEHLKKEHGITDISENDVAAVLAGKAKVKGAAKTLTDYETLKAEARGAFQEQAKQNDAKIRLAEQEAREASRKENRDAVKMARAKIQEATKKAKDQVAAVQRMQREESLLRSRAESSEYKMAVKARKEAEAKMKQLEAEVDRLKSLDDLTEKQEALWKARAEQKKLREAEAKFWKDVREQQKEWDKNQRAAKTQERKEYVKFWKASLPGQKSVLIDRIADMQEKLSTYAEEGVMPGAKRRLAPSKDPVLQAMRIKEASLQNQIYRVTQRMEAQAAFDTMGPWKRGWHKYNPFSHSRSLVASLDDSFGLNQGAMVLWSDPGAWAKGMRSSAKGLTKKGFAQVDAEVRAHPRYDQAEAANLFENHAEINDIFGTESNVPGISHSQRLYESRGKAIRLEMFDRWASLTESSKSGKPMTLEDYKALAQEVKAWTGQGVWGRNATHVTKPFFALRYRLSQFEVALAQPLFRTFAHGRETGNYAPFRVVLRKYGQAVTAAAATVGIAKLALKQAFPDGEWDIDINPLSSNAGKLVHKVGDTVQVYQVLPPSFMAASLLAKIGAGVKQGVMGKEESVENYASRGLREEIIGQWGINGLHPALGAAWGAMVARTDPKHEYFGRSYDFSKPEAYGQTAKSLSPIPVQNAIDVWANKDLSPWEKVLSTALLPWIQQGTYTKKEGGGRTSDRSSTRAPRTSGR